MGKTAIFADFSENLDVLTRLKLIKEFGFDGVMLNYNDDFSPIKVNEQVETARKLGLEICCAHLRFNDGNGLWRQEEDWTNLLRHDIESCHQNGISTCILHLTQGGNYPEANTLGIQRIARLAELCEKLNMTIAIENKRNSNHIEDVFKVVKSSALGFCYDIGHEAIYYPNTGDVIHAFSKYYPLKMLHLHDNHLESDEHMLPFDGLINYDKVIKALREVKYQGYILLEPRKEYSEVYAKLSLEEFLEKAISKAKILNKLINQ